MYTKAKYNTGISKILTTGIVVALGYCSNAFAEEKQTFIDPTIPAVNGALYRLDRCVNSYRYPDRCNEAASWFAASQFCRNRGFRAAFQWQFREENPHNVWIWTEEWSNGQTSSNYKIIRGTGIFSVIECTK